VSETADQLKTEIAGGEQQLAQYRTQLTDEHPRVQQLKDKIEHAKAVLSGLPAEVQQEPVTEQKAVAPEKPLSPIVQFIVGRPETKRTVKIDSKIQERIYIPPQPIPVPATAPGSTITKTLPHSATLEIVPNAWLLPSILISTTLVLAIVGLFLLKRRSDRVTDPNQVLAILPIPILGWIDQTPTARRTGEVLPGIHRLKSNLRRDAGSQPQEIIITSPDSGDGKTILAGALALNLAESGIDVTLVDANIINPTLAGMFCCNDAPGWQEAAVKHNLRVITCGGTLDSAGFKNLRVELRERSEVIIYDCPALSEDLSSLLLTDKDSHLVMVARIKHTSLDSLALAATNIRQFRVNKASLAFFAAPESVMIKTQYQTHLQFMH
jgi:hypothetical protein